MEDLSREQALESELESARRRIEELESRLEQEVRSARIDDRDHRFREAVIERAAEGVCVCHDVPEFPFVRFTVWNRRMTEITGYTMAEINRLGWYQTVYRDPHRQQRARERMDLMRLGEDLRSERWEIDRADGTRAVIAISTSVLTAEDGSVHVLGLMSDMTAHEEVGRQMMLARTDELTSLRNRRGFDEEAGLLLRIARREKLPLTLGYLDITGFKALNDQRGHEEGDRALVATARALAGSTRSTDVTGRIGGDEFAIVMLGADGAGARVFYAAMDERLREVIRTGGWDIGFSVGVITFSGRIPDLAEALRVADAAMYRAKRSARSAVVYEQVDTAREHA